MRRALSILVNVATLLGLLFVLPGCVGGGMIQQMESDVVSGSSGGRARQELGRTAGHVGTVFDFRYARLVSALEMGNATTKTVAESSDLRDGDEETKYKERRFVRLDVPLLSVWDADNGFGYPGTSVHRNSVDIWARGGFMRGNETSAFGGAALTYYQFGAVAVSLTYDISAEATDFRAPLVAGGNASSSFSGTNVGHTVGIELTLAAGEYALDIVKRLFEIDQRMRRDFGSR